MAQPDRTLGVDLGPNSIGWALVDEANHKIVAAGVRVFPEGVDNFDTKKEKSKSEDRRNARAMRRQTARRGRRKLLLRRHLLGAGLLPPEALLPRDDERRIAWERDQFNSADPYALRRRALDEALAPHELGRVFLHLAKRRGFLSNRKSDRQAKNDTKGLLAQMNQLALEMQTAGSRTLGEHLAQIQTDSTKRIRRRHTRREMYEAEFEAIWESQRRFHPGLLTDDLKYGATGRRTYPAKPLPKRDGQDLLGQVGIHGVIFFQRPLRPVPRSIVGRCELEPKQRRCPKADRLAQRFRILQDVNNLRYIEPESGDEFPLSIEQRTVLLERLSRKKEMTFDDIRKTLGFLETVKFNLESGHRVKLQGHVTDAALANKNVFGREWHDRPESTKDAIVRAMLELDDRELLRVATTAWRLSDDAARRLLEVDLPDGYLRFSRAALERLVPPMERGLLLMTDDGMPSALSEAGYSRRDQRARQTRDNLPPPPDVANPVVRQALHEVRKVVNAIVREYGKPACIHVELARNAKASTEERQRLSQEMRERERIRDAAADDIRGQGHKPTRESIDRWLLWKDQHEHCVYCLKPISPGQLLGGEADIDHILPYSRCLDGSFPNRVVACTPCNRDKGNHTPYEWLAERQPDRYEKVREWARARLSYQKYKRFTQKTLDLDKFIARQLNDTRYISRVVLEYLQCLLPRPHDALGLKGQQTATLRHHWGLNTVLRHDDIDIKNRDDHRHHAVDAVVVALTDRNRLQQLSAIERRGGTARTGEILIEPWAGFRADVEGVVNEINVSHRARRKVAGALHEDTFYGKTNEPGVFVVRKPLEALTPAMVGDIRDPVIRQIVASRLREHGIDVGRKKRGKPADGEEPAGRGIPKEVWKEPLVMPSGVVIKKVRILKRDETIRPLRAGGAEFVKPGAVHHVCLFEWQENGKRVRDAVFVSMLEAIQRVKRREPLIQHAHPNKEGVTFLLSLSNGEMVLLDDPAPQCLYRFETAASTSKQMWFRLHNVAGRSSDKAGVVSKKPGTFRGIKVTVDMLGRIRSARD